MSIADLVKTERNFLVEKEIEKNDKGVYVFTSQNGFESISLDYFLNEYKSWLQEKGLIKIL